MNNVTLVGRLTKEPKVKYVGEAQTLLAEFTIAVNRKYKKLDNHTDFIPIQVWSKTAENCAKYLNKGSLVGVQGQIRIEKYKNKDGENRYTTKVIANNVQFISSSKNTELTNDKLYDGNEIFEEQYIESDYQNI